MTLEALRECRVVVLAHYASTGATEELREWLLHQQVREVIYIAFPFGSANLARPIQVEHHHAGKLTKRHTSWWRWRLPEPLAYTKDLLYAMLYTIRFGRRADLLFAGDNLLTLGALLARTPARIAKIIYYMIDYTPRRFANPLLNQIYRTVDRWAVEGADRVWTLTSEMLEARFASGQLRRSRTTATIVPYGTHPLPDTSEVGRTVPGEPSPDPCSGNPELQLGPRQGEVFSVQCSVFRKPALDPGLTTQAPMGTPGSSSGSVKKKCPVSSVQCPDLSDNLNTEHYPLLTPAAPRATIVYMGEIMRNKGAELFVPMARELQRLLPTFHLSIIGGGADLEALRQEVAAANLQHQITLHGFIENFDDLLAILATGTVAIAPYYPHDKNSFTYYCDPGKVKVYLGCGLPIVLTDVPPIARQLEQAGAGLIADYDPAQFAATIARLIQSPDYHTMRHQAQQLGAQNAWSVILPQAISEI